MTRTNPISQVFSGAAAGGPSTESNKDRRVQTEEPLSRVYTSGHTSTGILSHLQRAVQPSQGKRPMKLLFHS